MISLFTLSVTRSLGPDSAGGSVQTEASADSLKLTMGVWGREHRELSVVAKGLYLSSQVRLQDPCLWLP